jgi:hypothetical protein
MVPRPRSWRGPRKTGRRRGSGRRLGLGPGQEVLQEGAEMAGCGPFGFTERALQLAPGRPV